MPCILHVMCSLCRTLFNICTTLLTHIFCILSSGNVSFAFLRNCTLPLSANDKMVKEAMDFILAYYTIMRICQTLTQIRQEVWKAKMAKSIAEPPKLYSLPPTSKAFHENAKRGHLQLAIWLHVLEPEPRPNEPWQNACNRPNLLHYPTSIPQEPSIHPESYAI